MHTGRAQRIVRWQPRGGEQLPSTNIVKLFVARDGRLWIGTFAGLASLRDGHLVTYAALAGETVVSLVEDSQATVWAGTINVPNARLCAIRDAVECVAQDGRLGLGVFSLLAEGDRLWVAAATGLWRWAPGDPTRYASTPDIHDLMKHGDGQLLIAATDRLRQFAGDRLSPYPIRDVEERLRPQRLLADRDGGLWVATATGLTHVHAGEADVFTRSDGLSGDSAAALFEDREGNIWVATNEGLDRFRELAVTTLSRESGLPAGLTSSVLRARRQRMDRHAGWVDQMEGRSDHDLRET